MVLRLGGLVSGMDTDSMVKELMKVQRMSLDKLTQQKQQLEWKRDDYRTLNSKIMEFKNASFNMKLDGTYFAKTISSSNENAVTAVATGSAVDGTYKIKINRLATTATITSGDLALAPGSAKIMSDLGLTETAKITITGDRGQQSISVNTTDKLSDVIAAINGKTTSTGVSVTYDEGTDRLFFVNSKSGPAMTLRMESADGTPQVDPAGAAVNLLSTVFSISGTTQDTTGSQIVIPSTQNEVYFNDVLVPVEGNTFTIAGIKITAKQATGTDILLGVSQDVDKVYDNIKSYVDKYNELIDMINKKVDEKKYRDFMPLTDEQRTDMKDDEIKKWEEKAKSGLLSNDQLLLSGLSSFRASLIQSVGGIPSNQLNNLSEMGISASLLIGQTVSGTYLDKGKLYIDDTKLKKAIAENPEQVKALFTADDGTNNDTRDGIAVRMYDKSAQLIDKIIQSAGATGSEDNKYTIGKEMKRINSRLDDMTRRLTDLENRYYRQFSTMESYLNKMNAQSAWLSQQFQKGG